MSNAAVYTTRPNALINLLNPTERPVNPTLTAQQSGWDQTRPDNTSRQGEHYAAGYGEYSVPPMLSSATRHTYNPYQYAPSSSNSSYPSWQPPVPQGNTYPQQESYASAQAPYDHDHHYHDQYRASSSSMEYNPPPPPPQQPLQYSSRASTRIVARATGTPSLESQYPIQTTTTR
ncbi:hypothetical protein CPB85DRAFT_181822 [Mucidula mucida]|nr:hypothetical protein CPB85DRAFT_181822 [Mucidula mucida]